MFQWVAWSSSFGYLPPDEYEQAYRAPLEEAPLTA